MVSTTEDLLVERIRLNDDGAEMALVTLNRPESMNPISWSTVRELGTIFSELGADQDVRVVAITGAGKAFSAGGDMKGYVTLQRDSTDFPRFLADFHESFGNIASNPKPFVALVNGIAIAGGIELLLSCDLAIGSESARIGDAHLPYGQMGGGGVLTLLPRAVGPARARELVLSGRILGAQEAMEWGLISKVVPDDQLLAAGIEFARAVAAKSSLAVANAKQVMNAAWSEGTGISGALRLEREVTARYCVTSADAHEGLAAFSEKRSPRYVGA
jgi:enoyl-CoA hydratase/carnithine racemase